MICLYNKQPRLVIAVCDISIGGREIVTQGKEYRMTLTGGMAYIHDNAGEFFAMSANKDGDLCNMYYHVDAVFNEISENNS